MGYRKEDGMVQNGVIWPRLRKWWAIKRAKLNLVFHKMLGIS